MRLFFAFKVPEVENDRVEELVSELESQLPGARWVPRKNRHVTVRFLGSVRDGSIPLVKDAARRACSSVGPGRVSLEGIGAFPRPSYARVLWAGVRDHDGTAAALFERLEEALQEIGWTREERGYTPHFTLARFKEATTLPTALTDALERGPSFTLERLVLMASNLSPKGARYEDMDSFPLG